MHHLHHFNPLAIVVCAILVWVIGAIWYSLLFAKPWAAMVLVRQEGKSQSMISGMVASFLGDLILVFVLAHLILWSNAETIHGGVFVAFITWLGFFIAPLLPQNIYESRPFKLFAINMGYWFVALLSTGAILAVWH